jgi:hypothetical protein
MKLSIAQKEVLEWLAAFPDVEISANVPFTRPRFTMWWANEAARRMMIKPCDDLAPILGDMQTEKAEPRWTPPTTGTPRLTTQTFNVLHMRQLIHATKHRPQQGGLAEMYWYQISAKGERLLLNHIARLQEN